MQNAPPKCAYYYTDDNDEISACNPTGKLLKMVSLPTQAFTMSQMSKICITSSNIVCLLLDTESNKTTMFATNAISTYMSQFN